MEEQNVKIAYLDKVYKFKLLSDFSKKHTLHLIKKDIKEVVKDGWDIIPISSLMSRRFRILESEELPISEAGTYDIDLNGGFLNVHSKK